MRHRSFAVRTRCANVTFRPNVESQNFVGVASPGGHSIKSHSSGTVSIAAWRSCAERTLTRAKREDRISFVPSRQRIVLQLLFGNASASFSTLINVLSLRPRRQFAASGEANVSGAQTVFVVLTPATYLSFSALISLLNFASTPYPASMITTPRGRPAAQAHLICSK